MNTINFIQRIIGYLIVLLCLLSGCENETIIEPSNGGLTDSTSSKFKFQQITLLVNLYDSVNGYANLQKIDSIKINVNGKYWGTFSSESRDTADSKGFINDNIKYSVSKINYLVIASYQLKIDSLETVGDFVYNLNNRIILAPGDYICEISEVKFKNIAGEWIKFKPQIYKEFKVVENTTSSFAGEFEISFR